MRLSKYMVTIPVANEKAILINSLNGKIYEITREEYKKLSQIKSEKDIINLEKKFLENLKNAGFIIKEKEDEEKKFLKLLQELKEKKEMEESIINEIVLVLTYECNFACPYCYEKHVKRNRKYFTKDMIDKVFDLYKNIEKIAFFGGEPLLLENKKIIEYIVKKRQDVVYSMMTNGYYLEEFCDIFRNKKVECIQVTMDGPEKIHNKSRILKNGDGTFEKIMRGIYSALECGYPIRIRMNVNERNINDCIKFREELCKELKEYKELVSFELYPVFQTNEKNKLLEMLYKEDLKEKDLDKVVKNNNILCSGLPIENYFISNIALKPIMSYCEAHDKKRFLDVEGNIYSCILSVGKPEMIVGKFYPEHEMKKKSFITRDISKINECKKCKYAFLCGGGCPLQLANNNQDIYKPNCGGMYNALNCTLPCIVENRKV